LRVWYGNAGASDGQQKSSVPDSNTKLFMPLEESYSLSAGNYKDWTSNANDGTMIDAGGNFQIGTSGIVGNAYASNGANTTYITGGSTNIPDHTAGAVTLSCWVKLSSLGTYPAFLWSADVGLNIFAGGNLQFMRQDNNSPGATASASGLTGGAWHQVVGTWDGTHSHLYVDGALVNTDTTVGGNYGYTGNTNALIGTGYNNESPNGAIDEPTIANVARSADWISFDYQNKFNNRVSWGSELSAGGGGVTATPGTASLTLTRYAPAVLTPRLCTPGVKTLTLSPFAPTVSTPRSCTPGKLALTTTGYAPSVQTPRVATPGKATLTITSYAPTVSTPRTATPGRLPLLLTTYAPNVLVPGGPISPGTATLTITRYAPSVLTPRTATPAAGSLTLTAFAPTIRTPRVVIPGRLQLALATFAPTIGLSGVVAKFPNAGTLVRIGAGGTLARMGIAGTLLRESGA
jgi:hypothetical protein